MANISKTMLSFRDRYRLKDVWANRLNMSLLGQTFKLLKEILNGNIK